jgi:hypothetical protein
MRLILKIIDFIVSLMSRKKIKTKKMDDVPKDNYPMF